MVTLSPSPLFLPADCFCALRFDRFSMSALSSVVSDGSPGSSLLMLGMPAGPFSRVDSAVTVDRVRGLLFGGLLVASRELVDFLCLELVKAAAGESSASSPEASRDDGWSRSTVEDFKILLGRCALRFRLLEPPEDEGEDIDAGK